MNKKFTKRLKDLRLEKGVTQKEVGQAIGVTGVAIANYELGTREPSLETLAKLCKFFNVSADYLIGLTDF